MPPRIAKEAGETVIGDEEAFSFQRKAKRAR